MYEYPCDYPIKVFGAADKAFEKEVLKIFKKHKFKPKPSQISRKKSKKDQYLSLTITIFAESKKVVEDLYRDLKACKHVLMVL